MPSPRRYFIYITVHWEKWGIIFRKSEVIWTKSQIKNAVQSSQDSTILSTETAESYV